MSLIASPPLRVVSLETLDACNRACWFCKFGQEFVDTASHIMPMETIKKVLGELGKADFDGRISPFGINEPLLDKRIIDICAMARMLVARCKMTILTNGDLLDEAKCEKLSALEVTIGVSVYDDKTMEKALGLTRKFALRILDYRAPVFASNRAGHIVELALRKDPAFNMTVRKKSSRQMLKDLGRLDEPTPYQRALGITVVVPGKNPMIERDCLRPSTLMQIRWNGNVVQCCCDFHEQVVVGNVNQQMLTE